MAAGCTFCAGTGAARGRLRIFHTVEKPFLRSGPSGREGTEKEALCLRYGNSGRAGGNRIREVLRRRGMAGQPEDGKAEAGQLDIPGNFPESARGVPGFVFCRRRGMCRSSTPVWNCFIRRVDSDCPDTLFRRHVLENRCPVRRRHLPLRVTVVCFPRK